MSENLEYIREFFERLEDRVNKRLDKVEDKIDKLADISAANAVKLAENTASLIDHIRRTELLEEEIKMSKAVMKQHETDDETYHEKMDAKQIKIEDDIDFIVKFPKYLYLFGKWIAGIGAAAATIYSFARIFFKV